jgi:hypothetical protein
VIVPLAFGFVFAATTFFALVSLLGRALQALADELHRRGFPVWYPDGRPVSFIEDDWYDDFPLVWADGWFSTAA